MKYQYSRSEDGGVEIQLHLKEAEVSGIIAAVTAAGIGLAACVSDIANQVVSWVH